MNKLISIIFLIFAINLSAAFSADSEVNASGEVQVTGAYGFRKGDAWEAYDRKDPSIFKTSSYANVHKRSSKVSVKYIEWGQGKIRGNITFSGVRECSTDKTLPFFGMDLGFGEFEIFKSTEDLLDSKNSIGRIVKYATVMTVILEEDLFFSDVNSRNYICILGVKKHTSLELKVR